MVTQPTTGAPEMLLSTKFYIPSPRPDGQRVPGMYIVTPQGVKAVFTHQGRDVIATFFFDAHAGVLKIVTSRTGQASLYRKLH